MIRSLAYVIMLAYAVGYASAQAGSSPAVEIQFVELRAAGDSFTMGDGTFGPKAVKTFSYDFSISKFPITNGQFGRFIAEGGYTERSYWTANGWKWKGKIEQPAYWKDVKFNVPEQPVVGVSWYEAVAYCNWLSLVEGLVPAYDDSGRVISDASGYRLPTEAEWEYAAAKGAPDQEERIFPWGNAWDSKNAVCRVSPAKAANTAPVGSKSPQGDTPQGLADMCGNVWQWCSDNAESDAAISGSAGTDRYFFKSDSTGSHLVLRGGSWWNDFQNGFRAAFRNFSALPGNRNNTSGFRIARR
jgi:formylglycine-generating enzyme required for sulfatase activity